MGGGVGGKGLLVSLYPVLFVSPLTWWWWFSVELCNVAFELGDGHCVYCWLSDLAVVALPLLVVFAFVVGCVAVNLRAVGALTTEYCSVGSKAVWCLVCMPDISVDSRRSGRARRGGGASKIAFDWWVLLVAVVVVVVIVGGVVTENDGCVVLGDMPLALAVLGFGAR